MSNLNLAECFQYRNPSNQDLVVTALLEDYVKLIGVKVCALVEQVNMQGQAIGALALRMAAQEARVIPTSFPLPELTPTGIATPNTPLPLVTYLALLESLFVQERSAVGIPNDIYDTISLQIATLGTQKALGITGGTVGALSGWIPSVVNLNDYCNNLGILIQDMRSGIQDIKAGCCANSCNSIEIVMQATYANKILRLYFTGSIPTNLVTCRPLPLFKIADQSGNYVNQAVDVPQVMNDPTGLTVDLTFTPLNFADDLTITAIACLTDTELGTVCQKVIDKNVVNNASCPSVSYNVGISSVLYSFIHATSASLTYTIELYDMANEVVQSQSVAVSEATTVTGGFTGLDAGTGYKVRIKMVTTNSTRVCPFTQLTTLPTGCAAPNSITTELIYT